MKAERTTQQRHHPVSVGPPPHPLKAEPYVTVRQGAVALGIKYHALLAAVNDGTIPSYRPFNSRRLVRISEIESVIRSYQVGGAAK